MDKTGQVEVGKTPCVKCGRASESTHKGEAFCMSCYLKVKHQWQPQETKLASHHQVR
jgi:NMD protein affecting ribosome stability and mRNA decay